MVAPHDVCEKLAVDFPGARLREVAAGDMLSFCGIGIEVLPSYNVGKPYHPKENGWVGYIIRTGDGAYYLPGDCDVTPEFLEADADVVFVPIGGTYTMDVEQAAQAINQMKPKLVIPFHFGDVEGVGVREDGERFLSCLTAWRASFCNNENTAKRIRRRTAFAAVFLLFCKRAHTFSKKGLRQEKA